MKSKIIITVFLSCFISGLWAQDYFFTQNTTTLNLSPSFAGINSNASRFNFGYKVEPVTKLYNTIFISYDQFFDKIKSGIGLNLLRDAGAGSKIGTSKICLNYTFEFDITKKVKVRPGINFSLGSEFVDFPDLVFGDQISTGGTSPVSIESPPIPSYSYLDFSSSLLIFGDKFWAGLTADHLVPSTNSAYFNKTYKNIQISCFGGYKFLLSESVNSYFEKSIVLTTNYVTNSKFDFLDFRTYLNWDILTVALGYRNSPKAFKQYNSSSIIAIAGINLKNLKIGYSFDWGINSYINYQEVSLTYLIPWIKVKKEEE